MPQHATDWWSEEWTDGAGWWSSDFNTDWNTDSWNQDWSEWSNVPEVNSDTYWASAEGNFHTFIAIGVDLNLTTYSSLWSETTFEWYLRDPAYSWITSDQICDMRQHPLAVILDLGCTRPMGSRKSIERFARSAHKYHIKVKYVPCNSRFTFANSEVSYCTQALMVRFPTDPPVETQFDIVEEGDVPILFSLGQMSHLGFEFKLKAKGAYLTSKRCGWKEKPLPRAAHSGHLVLDLKDILSNHSSSKSFMSESVAIEYLQPSECQEILPTLIHEEENRSRLPLEEEEDNYIIDEQISTHNSFAALGEAYPATKAAAKAQDKRIKQPGVGKGNGGRGRTWRMSQSRVDKGEPKPSSRAQDDIPGEEDTLIDPAQITCPACLGQKTPEGRIMTIHTGGKSCRLGLERLRRQAREREKQMIQARGHRGGHDGELRYPVGEQAEIPEPAKTDLPALDRERLEGQRGKN